jgi:D-alanine-D-alanine ligase
MIQVEPDWWKTLFDNIYLLTDARSVDNHDLTRREIDLLSDLLPLAPGSKILDLCGGHGRHIIEIGSRDHYDCTLLDYSRFLLNKANASASRACLALKCIQADARRPGLASSVFSHVFILGNSLGYQNEPDADHEILTEACRVLRPGGWLVIDVANGERIRNQFSPEAWHEIGTDTVVCRRRELGQANVKARELVISKANGLIRDRTYAIRLYDAAQIKALMTGAGFQTVTVHTDFGSYEHEGDYGFMHHRMVVIGQK